MTIPVILLTFANDQDAYLENLKEESHIINRNLSPLEDRQFIKIHREESAGADKILEAVLRFDDRVALFHYGGHADGSGLQLEKGAGYAEGLAQLLARQKKLQLVFLNGCSTRPQVARLLELGVKAIIATASSIDDQKATAFARDFYRKLGNGSTLRQAFDFASNSLQLRFQNASRPICEAVDGRRGLAGREGNNIPWGLYYQAAFPEILNWTLPSTPPADPQGSTYPVNEALYDVLDAMADQDEKIPRLINLEDERESFALIIKYFPWNIGAQINALVSGDESMKTPGGVRFEQILSTYIATVQWMYFVVFSQYWRETAHNKLQRFIPGVKDLFDLTIQNFGQFDYLDNFKKFTDVLQGAGIRLFLPELGLIRDDLERQNELSEACFYLESQRQIFFENPAAILPETELAGRCRPAEEALGLWLSRLAFLVKYKMLTVREILINNPRHDRVHFLHKLGPLNHDSPDRLFIFNKPRDYNEFLQNNSIILIKDMDRKEGLEYLNLSPFYMDKNAFLKKDSWEFDLYTFVFTKPDIDGGREYVYLRCRGNILNGIQKELDRVDTGLEIESNLEKKGIADGNTRIRKIRGDQSLKPFSSLKDQFESLAEHLKSNTL